MRTAAALVLVVGLTASLAACSPSPYGDCEVTPSGGVSDSVKVSGTLGELPEVTIAAPLAVEATQRTVVKQGDGDIAEAGFLIGVKFVLYNGTSGAEIDATTYSGSEPLVLNLGETLVGLTKTFQCSRVGSRVVGVMSPEDIGASVLTNLGAAETDSLVIVADVLSVDGPPLARAEGEPQPLPEGFPAITVDLAEDGTPTLTLPGGEPPAELQLAVLQKGSGAVVGAGADVIVHYVGMNWQTGAVFDASWSRGTPATFNTAGVIPGFTAAIEGQTVGSQVLVVIPPDQGYGPTGGTSDGSIGATDTIVFVIDILGIA